MCFNNGGPMSFSVRFNKLSIWLNLLGKVPKTQIGRFSTIRDFQLRYAKGSIQRPQGIHNHVV